MTKAYYSIKEFAELLSVHHNTIRNSIKMGRINAFRVGYGPKAALRIPSSELSRIAEKDMIERIKNKD